MPDLEFMKAALDRFELYESQIAREYRSSPHIAMLAAGHHELAVWEASSLEYFSGPSNADAFLAFVDALNPPAAIRSAMDKAAHQSRTTYWWGPGHAYERVESLRLKNGEAVIRCGNRNGRYLLRMAASPFDGGKRERAVQWLIESEDRPLHSIARGFPLERTALSDLGLMPAWDDLRVSSSSKSATAIALGVKILCRALVRYPAYVLIWRGLGGQELVRQSVERRLEEYQREFEQAAAGLPQTASEFWAAPELPPISPPEAIVPDPGHGAHLPPAHFWAKDEENKAFNDALARMYRNVPKKVVKLVERRY